MVGEIKVVVVGDSNVGKSSLINTHCPPITGVEDASIVNVGGVSFVLCDTFGAQRFRTLTSGFYKYARGVLIVFDVTDRETFSHVSQWMSEVRLRTHAAMPVVVVANKCDATAENRKVSRDEASRLCLDMEVGYAETSALLYSASAQADGGGALAQALRLLLDRIPQAPAMSGAARLAVDKKRRHRSVMMSFHHVDAPRPGKQFALPPIVRDDATPRTPKETKKHGFLAALRTHCKGERGIEARRRKYADDRESRASESAAPVYDLKSVATNLR